MTSAPDTYSTLNDDVPPDNPLTTKEGWGAFVRHTSEPPTLLTTKELAARSPDRRSAYDEMRRDYHSDLPLVNTSTIQKVISTRTGPRHRLAAAM